MHSKANYSNRHFVPKGEQSPGKIPMTPTKLPTYSNYAVKLESSTR